MGCQASSSFNLRKIAASLGFVHKSITFKFVGFDLQLKRWLASCGESLQRTDILDLVCFVNFRHVEVEGAPVAGPEPG